MSNTIDLTGRRYGRLLVISQGERKGEGRNRRYYWNCTCDCGTSKQIQGNSLRNGTTLSCGCLHREISKQNFLKRPNLLWIEHQGTKYVAADFLRLFGHPKVRPEVFRNRVRRGIDPMTAANTIRIEILVQKEAA